MKARIAGTDLNFDVRGRGPAILLLHAFPLSLGMWDEQVRSLEGTHQVIRFDARGFGATPPGDGLLTMERIADDAALLLDHLDVPSAVVCGVSMAGADSEEARRNRSLQADEVRRSGAGALAESSPLKLLGDTTRKRRPELVARVKEMILATPPRGITDALAGLASRADSTPALREIRVPTLVVCGLEDTLTPVADAEALQKGIAGSRLELIPEAGHLSNLENPAAFDAALKAFLGGLG
jgi:pimeloyl-ACP methyl ester carboxylesterase